MFRRPPARRPSSSAPSRAPVPRPSSRRSDRAAMIDEYHQLAARAFDEPYAGELRQRLVVCADALQAAGDPLGTLIALGDALHDATGARASDLRQAIDHHARAHYAAEL